jgi:hypothetical protein
VSPEIQYSTVLDAIVFYVGKRKRAAETDDSEKREMEEIYVPAWKSLAAVG